MEKEDHRRNSDGPKNKDAKYDRHAANGASLNPKKGGHGGWGTYNDDEVDVIDKNDPNYDEEDEKIRGS